MLHLVLRVASVLAFCASVTLMLCLWLRQRVAHHLAISSSLSSSLSSSSPSLSAEAAELRDVHVASLSLADFSSLANLQASYQTLRFVFEMEFYLALLCFCCVYLIKQTFAIPGSMLLNLFAGAMLPFYVAFPLVCSLTACGASCCFLLSASLGSQQTIESVCDRLLPGKRLQLQLKIRQAKESNDLLFVLLFLRLFPFSPNWLLNLSSPWLQVPLPLFSISVFLGLMPYNFITVQAGTMLSSLKNTRELMDPTTLGSLVVFSAGVLIPTLIKKRKNKNKGETRENYRAHKAKSH